MSLASPAAAGMPAVPAVTAVAAVPGGAAAGDPSSADSARADGVVSSRLRSSDSAMVGVTEFCGVLADTSFDPACPVDEYDDFVDGKWVPRPLRLMHELRVVVHPARARVRRQSLHRRRGLMAAHTDATPMETRGYSTSAWQTAR